MNPKSPMKPMPEAKWPPRVFYGRNRMDDENFPGNYAVPNREPIEAIRKHFVEYLSLEEHTHLLSEAVREAKAQAFEDAVDMADSVDTRGELITNLVEKAAELRENGWKK